jgi:DNA replication ATP-dependent helicase Dna2
MNVSFTRARSKLIIFGSRKTLQTAPLLTEFFTLMEAKGWILRLPPNAQSLHPVVPSGVAGIPSGNKRVAEAMDEKENCVAARPTKKMKKPKTEDGFLKGRPILQDLVNGER